MTRPNRRRLGWPLAGILGIALVLAAIVAVPMQGVQTDGNVVPTARVAQGDVPVVVHATGDLRPLKAQALVPSGDLNSDGLMDVAALTSPTTITVSLANWYGGYSVSAILTPPKGQQIFGFTVYDRDDDEPKVPIASLTPVQTAARTSGGFVLQSAETKPAARPAVKQISHLDSQ